MHLIDGDAARVSDRDTLSLFNLGDKAHTLEITTETVRLLLIVMLIMIFCLLRNVSVLISSCTNSSHHTSLMILLPL
jgi:hypothetical protein